MGAKKKSRQRQSVNNYSNNVVDINIYQKKTSVNILPRNLNQESYVLRLLDQKKDIVFGIGPAGTGKTILAVQVAVKLFKEGAIDKIIVTRPAVSVDEDLGFLPGTLEQKMAPWTRPIMDCFEEYYSPDQIDFMLNDNKIEVAPLAYMRGRTFKNSYIIADEMQNATDNQMKMLLTRIGNNSKLIVTGDLAQHERGYESNGLKCFIDRLTKLGSDRIKVVQFGHEDIERHPVVTEVLRLYNES